MTPFFWVVAGFLAVAWLSPLHVPPWLSWQNEIAAGAAVLVGCVAVLFRRTKQGASGSFPLPTVALPAALLAAIALVQLLAGTIAYWGSFWVIAFYSMAAVASAAAGFSALQRRHNAPGRPPNALFVLAAVVLAAGVLQLFVVFAQVFDLWLGSDWIARTGYRSRGTGNMAQPNHAALLFLMGFVSALYLGERRSLSAPLALAALVLMGLGMCTTQSRSGVLGFGVILAWWASRGVPFKRPQAFAIAGAGIVAFLCVFAVWPSLVGAYWFLEHTEQVNLTANGRLEIWRQLLDAVLLRPWAGWGVLQVAEAQNAIADSYALVMASTYSHNLVLDIALWAGIPAAAALVVAAFIWGARRVRLIHSQDSWFCAALALPVVLQSLSEFPYAYAYFLVPFFFALGALDATLGVQPGLRVGRRLAQLLTLVALAGFAGAVVEYAGIEEDFRVARFEAMRMGKVPAGYEQPKVVLLTQLGALLTGTRIQPVPGMPASEIETLRNVAMLYPWAPASLRYLTALALNGQMDEARRQLKIIRVMHGKVAYSAAQERLAEMSETHPVLKALAAP